MKGKQMKTIPPGLLEWVEQYKAARKNGNVHLARQIKRQIDKEVKKLNLDPDRVYFHAGDPDAPETLRSKTIRLAHDNPDLRADLLPLLKEAATTYIEKTPVKFRIAITRILDDDLRFNIDTEDPEYGDIMGGWMKVTFAIYMKSYIPFGGNQFEVPIFVGRDMPISVDPENHIAIDLKKTLHKNQSFNRFLKGLVQDCFRDNWPSIQNQIKRRGAAKLSCEKEVEASWKVLITKLDNINVHYGDSPTYCEMLYGRVTTTFALLLTIPSHKAALPIFVAKSEPALLYQDPGGGIYLDLESDRRYHPNNHYHTFLWHIVNEAYQRDWSKWIKDVPSDLEQP